MIARIVHGLAVAALLMLLAFGSPAFAEANIGSSRTVDNVTIYLGVLPAEMIRGHATTHPESSMHGGAPTTGNEYHVVIALFDAKSGKRITGAHVSARVSDVGLVGPEKELRSMEIAGTETYGNYFSMAGNGPFRIDVVIRLPGESRDIKAEFEHRHQ